MSRPDVSPHGLARTALQRERLAVTVALGGLQVRFSMPMPRIELQAGDGGITHLVDSNTGERLGCAVDASVLERTRLFFNA